MNALKKLLLQSVYHHWVVHRWVVLAMETLQLQLVRRFLMVLAQLAKERMLHTNG
jgi:hypothetical protein